MSAEIPNRVRDLSPADRAAWQPLWDGYLRFYRERLDPAISDDAFARLSERRDGMAGLIAEIGDRAVGLAHMITHPSTWATGPYVYLEDLYVDPAARGADTGRALIDAVYAYADSIGAANVYWHTQEFNGAARSLYDQLAHRTSFVVYER